MYMLEPLLLLPHVVFPIPASILLKFKLTANCCLSLKLLAGMSQCKMFSGKNILLFIAIRSACSRLKFTIHVPGFHDHLSLCILNYVETC